MPLCLSIHQLIFRDLHEDDFKYSKSLRLHYSNIEDPKTNMLTDLYNLKDMIEIKYLPNGYVFSILQVNKTLRINNTVAIYSINTNPKYYPLTAKMVYGITHDNDNKYLHNILC